MTVLGISTNTRLVGRAIISEGRLTEYAIRLHKSPWSPAKATKIISGLEACVSRYSVKQVVLSIPPEYHQTKAFRHLRNRIAAYFAKKGIPLVEAPPETLEAFVSDDEKKIKQTLMKSLAAHFPELEYYRKKELRNKHKHYIKMFEAIAVAAVHEGQ
jgi:hypothetical protein